jgi:2-polyprenyl-3-methyl-5-hydroxy-6-metoxy-1,4-benzoquinol methylase
MQGWSSGYVTDIQYTDGFYQAQSPQHLALAAAINGFEPPDLDAGFAYCELGCGRGLTSLILAAANPNAEFHAVDFLPAHIAHASAQARAARLENLRFHERSFEDLTQPGAPVLPMFDVITMHGVWTWVAPECQQAIIRFLNTRLKPGGLVYVSYNAMPAWMPMEPLQRILKELAVLWPGRSDQAVNKAIAMLARLAEAKIIPVALQEGVKRLTGSPQRHLLPYLSHEYMNEHWKPAYHADVARKLAEAKLSFAGSTDLLKNFSNLCLNEQQRTLLAEIPLLEVRETLKDCCLNDWMRHDVFVRGARRMSEARRESLLNGLTLTLMRPAPEMIEIYRPDDTIWRPCPEAYQMFVKALEAGPRSVAELLALPDLPPGHDVRPLELVGVLVGTGLAAPIRQVQNEARSACDGLNRLAEADGEIALSQSATIGVPSVGGGMILSAGDFDLYMTLRRGDPPDAEALARRFVKRCKETGGHPIVDGKPVEEEAEAHMTVTRDFATKIERLVPIWRMIGMV